MFGLGTIINTAAVIAGGMIGLCLKNGLKEQLQKALMQACGVASIFIGVSGTLSEMLVVNGKGLETQGTMMLILSLVLGTILGEALRVEDRMDSLGERIKKAVKKENDSQFVDGFVSVSLIICVGAMAILGAMKDGISGDFTTLAFKAVLDGVVLIVFASTYGVGVIFSAVPLFVYQGSITLLSRLFGELASTQLIDNLSLVGSALIFCVGINIAFGKKFKVGNMLPALLIPAFYEIILVLHDVVVSLF